MVADFVPENDVRQAPSWRDAEIALPGAFSLESSEALSASFVRIRLYGDPAKPVIAVAGGISAGRAVADAGGDKGWWRDYVARGRAIDLAQYCVLGFDFLPNDGETARTLTTRDQARALAAALDVLKIDRLHAFVGSSYGGMTALAFAAEFSDRVENLVVISAAERPHVFGTALRGVQRRIVEFAASYDDPEAGVALARQLAMISYRTPREFNERFDTGPKGPAAGDDYAVCDYLKARGGAFAMSPQRYLTMSDSIDRHCVDLSAIRARVLFVAANGDQLCPPSEVRRCAAAITHARYVEVFSQFGHDAFLKEAAEIGPFIERFLRESTQ